MARGIPAQVDPRPQPNCSGLLGRKNGAPIGAGEDAVTSHSMRTHRSLAIRVSMILAVFMLTTSSVLRADDVVTHWTKVMLATIGAS